MPVKLTPVYRALVDDLAADPDMAKLATITDMDRAMTQHGYGAYAGKIDMLAKAIGGEADTRSRIIAAETLRTVGGDSRGIDAAMFSLFGIEQYDPAGIA